MRAWMETMEKLAFVQFTTVADEFSVATKRLVRVDTILEVMGIEGECDECFVWIAGYDDETGLDHREERVAMGYEEFVDLVGRAARAI